MTENQQVLTAAPQGAAVINRQGLRNGVYSWTIQVPIVVTYQSGTQKQAVPQGVTLTVVRQPNLESADGIGIDQWIGVPSSGLSE